MASSGYRAGQGRVEEDESESSSEDEQVSPLPLHGRRPPQQQRLRSPPVRGPSASRRPRQFSPLSDSSSDLEQARSHSRSQHAPSARLQPPEASSSRLSTYSPSADLSKVTKLASKCSVQQLRKILSNYEVKGMSKMRKETLIQNGIEVYRNLEEADRRQLVDALSDPTGKDRAVSSTVQGNPAPRGPARGRKRKAVDVWTKPRQPHRYGYFPEEEDDAEEDDTNTSGSRATSNGNGEVAGAGHGHAGSSSYDSEAADSTFVPSETSDDSSEHSTEIMPPSFLNPSLNKQHKARRPQSTVSMASPAVAGAVNHPAGNSASHSRPRITLTLPKSVVTGQSRPSTGSAQATPTAGVSTPASPSPSPSLVSTNAAPGNAFMFSSRTFPLNQPMRINTSIGGGAAGQSPIRPYVPRTAPAAPSTSTANNASQQYWPPSPAMPQSPVESNPSPNPQLMRSKRGPDQVALPNNSNGYAPMSPSSYGIGPPLNNNSPRSFVLNPTNLPGPYTPSSQASMGGSSRSGSGRQYQDYLEQYGYLDQGMAGPSNSRGPNSSHNAPRTAAHLFGLPIGLSANDYAAAMGMDPPNAQRTIFPTNNHRSSNMAVNGDGFDLSQYLSVPTSQPQRPSASNNANNQPQRGRMPPQAYQSNIARDPAVLSHGRPLAQSSAAYAQPNQQMRVQPALSANLGANSIMVNNPFAAAFSSTVNERNDRLEEKVEMCVNSSQELRFAVVKPTFQGRPYPVDGGNNHGRVIKAPVFHHTIADVTTPLSIRRDPSLTTRGVYREIITTFYFDQSKAVANDQHMVLMRFCQETVARPCQETHPDNLKLMLNGKTLVEPSVVDFSNRMKKKKNTVYNQPIEVPLTLIAAQNVVLVRWTEDTGQNMTPGGAPAPEEPPKDYFLVVEYARRKTTEEITSLVERNRVSMADTVYKLYQTLSGTDDDIVTDSQKISLLCPASRLRLALPVRGRSCDHVDCFDASSFLFMNKAQKARWTCPKCNKPVHFDEIVVDEFLQQLLDSFPNSESIEATLDKEQIVVKESSKPPEPEHTHMSAAHSPSSASRPSSGNAGASSSGGGGGGQAAARSAAAKAAVEVITLD